MQEQGMDALIYGILANRVSSWGKLNNRLFMLLSDNKQILQWISEKKSPVNSRMDLSLVTRI